LRKQEFWTNPFSNFDFSVKRTKRKRRIEDSDLCFFFAHYTIMRRAREYGRRSYRAEFSDQTKYFDKIGSYTDQNFHIWHVLDLWNNPVPYWDGELATIFFKKYKRGGIFVPYTGSKEDSYDWDEDGEDVKYLNKVNGGFNITRYVYGGYMSTKGLDSMYRHRIESVFPGKFGNFVGAQRRKEVVLFSWWHHLFGPMLDLANARYAEAIEPKKDPKLFRQYLTFRILTLNNQFLRFFFVLARYISMWPSDDVVISLEYNFKKFNLVFKKKRYLKKYKRSVKLTADRGLRRDLLIRPL